MGAWRLMVRLARRDLRRHRGRALLTAALVALPTFVLATLATFVATLTVDNSERLTSDLGTAPAAVSVSTFDASAHDRVGIRQVTADPNNISDYGITGKLLHGKQATDAGAIGELTGGTAYPLTVSPTRVVIGDRRIRANVLGTDGNRPVYAGTATLTSGRWPRTAGEVLVTDAGASIGIPTRGTFTLHRDGTPDRRVTVVGGARTLAAQDLVALPAEGAGSTTYLIDRTDPVTWSDVRRWNSYGLAVRSRLLVEHPNLVPKDPNFTTSDQGPVPTEVITILLTGVVLLTVLVAGPAFTTSADRHRRALGQLASNGATKAMLRRYVLAQALLLGALTAAGAVVVGGGLGLLLVAVARRVAPRHEYGPTDLPFTQLGVLALVAVLSALVAAVIPALGAGRVDVIAVLRGHVSPHRVRAGWPIVGLVLAAAGGFLLWRTITATNRSGGEVPIAVGGVLLFGGSVLALPWLLARVAGLARVLPVSGRIATRDIGRQRSRATSGVAAVMAATALMTALAIGGTSDIAQAKRDYEPTAPYGDAVVNGDSQDLTGFTNSARTLDPSLHIASVRTIGSPSEPSSNPTGAEVHTELTGTAVDCPASTSSVNRTWAGPCQIIGSGGFGGFVVLEPDDAARMLALGKTERAWLASGKLLALRGRYAGTDLVPQSIVRDGTMRLSWGSASLTSAPKPLAHSLTVPVATTDGSTPLREHFLRSGQNVIVPTSFATAQHWPTYAQQLRLSAPGGISADLQQQLSDRAPDGITLTVERGYHDKTMLVIEIMIAAFALIVLVVTLIGTALAQSESRADQATLAAVGAPRTIRRRIGAAYALSIGLVGGVVGFVVGLVPGIAVTWPLTVESWRPEAHDPLINIPWTLLAPALLGAPLLAALVAMVTTRSSPALTRRQAT